MLMSLRRILGLVLLACGIATVSTMARAGTLETVLERGVLICGIIVFGSVWVMAHLNHNLMPMSELMKLQR